MKRRSENYGILARNKKNGTLILGLLVYMIFSCNENVLVVTEEVICDFTETNTIGQIVGADDPSDWQPRLIPDTGFPASFAVAPAYPNPAGLDSVVLGDNPRIGCVISYAMVAGIQSVKVSVDNGPTLSEDIQQAGFYSIFWNLQDDSGQPLPERCYRIRISLTADETTIVSFGDIQIKR